MDRNGFMISRNAKNYAWRQLARRAGITGCEPGTTGFEGLGISVVYTPDTDGLLEKPGVFVVPCRGEAWQRLLNRPPHTIDWLPMENVIPQGMTLPWHEPTPVLFWGDGYEDGHKPFAERRMDGSIVFYVDIVATTLFMLSRWEETVVSTRDIHDRFPATASVAHRQAFLDRAIVDEYALILRAWLQLSWPEWNPKTHQFAIKLSHDIDRLTPFPKPLAGVRKVGGDLLTRQNPKEAMRTTADLVAQTFMPARSTQVQSIKLLADLSNRYALDSAFYFMAAQPAPHDDGYDPSASVCRRTIETLRRQGLELGFHPGYHTLDNPERLAVEKARLDAVLGMTKYGGRQHYLRFQVPNTWRDWETVGLTYDSTMGFPEYEGFRCGTCHPFRPFDLERNHELDLYETPLIVMDRTLQQYRKLSPEQSRERILELAQYCLQVEGVFTLLWHNSRLSANTLPWWETYERTVRALSDMST